MAEEATLVICMFDLLKDEFRQRGSVRFFVRARPGAQRTEATEKMDDESIKISVAAPPEGGKANAALIKFLAEEFSVPAANVKIVSGKTARMKLIQISL